MGQNTSIEWTDATWNPVRGCSRVSAGCVNCYAERQAARFAAPPPLGLPETTGNRAAPFHGFVTKINGHAAWTGKVELIEKHLFDPMKWETPRRIFVNSMSDLFHESLSEESLDRVFAIMALCPQHTFQILTKRAERMAKYWRNPGDVRQRWWEVLHDGRLFPGDQRRAVLGYPSRAAVAEGILKGWRSLQLPNVWLGVSVEDQKTADERIPLLLQTPAAVRFVSYEPALGPVNFWKAIPGSKLREPLFGCGNTAHLDLIIIGGESGPGARPFDIHWARNTVKQCKSAGVACFVKQLGAKPVQAVSGVDPNHATGYPTEPYNPHGVYKNDLSGRPFGLYDKKGGDWKEWPEDLMVREMPKAVARA